MADGSDPWHPAAEQPPSLHAHHDYQAVLFHRLRNFWHGKRWNRHLYVIPDDNDGPHLLLPDSYGLPPRGKTGWCIGLLAYFALVPFHAMYSLTMWKDILFGGVVLLFAISLWKLLNRYRSGESIWPVLPMFTITGVLMSLLRTNGFWPLRCASRLPW